MGTQRSEKVSGLLELDASLLGDLLGGERPELGMGIQAGADGGAADRQFTGTRVGVLDAFQGEVNLGHPAGEHLAEADRGGVLQVGAPDHDHVVVLLGLRVQGVAQFPDPRVHGRQLIDHGDMHGRREGVVGRLAAVDVVVGMDGGLGAEFPSGQFDGAVGDDLVDVHVGLGAGSGLEYHQRKVVIQFAFDDLITGLGNEIGDVARKLSELRIRQRRGFLQNAERLDHRPTPHEGLAPDVEVVKRPFGLGTPVPVGGHINGAHRVGFGAGVRCCHGNSFALSPTHPRLSSTNRHRASGCCARFPLVLSVVGCGTGTGTPPTVIGARDHQVHAECGAQVGVGECFLQRPGGGHPSPGEQ